MKKLENLGDVVGVPKVDLDALYPEKNYISHIHDLLMDDPVTFLEYAGTDAVVTLLYASALYGYNKKLPATITTATAKCLQAKMMDFFNLRTVDEFNKVYRGLHTVNRGLVEVEHGKLVNEYSIVFMEKSPKMSLISVHGMHISTKWKVLEFLLSPILSLLV